MPYKVSDNAATTLASSISNSPAVTSLVLTNAANFPVINHGGSGTDYSYVTLYDSANNTETVKVTRRDTGSNTLTIVRGTAAGITGVSDASCLAWAGTTTGVACRLIAHTVNELASAAGAATASAADAASSAADAASSAADAASSAADAASSAADAASSAADAASSAADAAAAAVTKDSATGSAQMPVGTTMQRPTGAAGKFRFNTTLNQFEGHNGTAWGAITGDTDIDKVFMALAIFAKADPSTVALTKTGVGSASLKAGTLVYIGSRFVRFDVDTPITMPTLAAGTDYAIWVKDDATIQATTNFTSPPSAGNWRKIGGFNYAPGGLATGTSGGDSTPQIIAGSMWDLKFRPACDDPRGMKYVNNFWVDLWPLNTEHITNGTSKFGATIADGSSLPRKPLMFGGNGTTTQADGNWWSLSEVLRSHGKRLPTYDEFAALAYGVTEATSRGSDPVTCQLDIARTSQHCFQATGNMWIWGAEFGGGAAGASWTANTGGRGSTYQMENAVLFGGSWASASSSGSRASYWADSPTYSYSNFGVRGVCDHLITD